MVRGRTAGGGARLGVGSQSAGWDGWCACSGRPEPGQTGRWRSLSLGHADTSTTPGTPATWTDSSSEPDQTGRWRSLSLGHADTSTTPGTPATWTDSSSEPGQTGQWRSLSLGHAWYPGYMDRQQCGHGCKLGGGARPIFSLCLSMQRHRTNVNFAKVGVAVAPSAPAVPGPLWTSSADGSADGRSGAKYRQDVGMLCFPFAFIV